MKEFTLEATLVACREENYTNYVFKDNKSEEYIFCTRLPNWQIPRIEIGESGYLQYNKVKAGDEYINPDTGEIINYKYTNTYIHNFVKKTDIFKNKEIIM